MLLFFVNIGSMNNAIFTLFLRFIFYLFTSIQRLTMVILKILLIMISKIKQFNPKLAALLFVIGIGHKQIFSILRKMVKALKKPAEERQQQYVGIHITNSQYYIGVGIPIKNRFQQIDDYMLISQKKGLLNNDPNITIPQIVSQLGNKQYKFVGVSSYWPPKAITEQIQFSKEEKAVESWESYPIFSKLKRSIRADGYAFENNINVNCLAEFKLANHSAKQSLVYVDIGREVLVGVIVGGKILHGFQATQGGHIIVERHPHEDPNFKGTCLMHQNCLQGYINTEAISNRCNVDMLRLHNIRDSDSVWKFIGFYLAQLCLDLTYLLSPEVIVINGEMMNRKQILIETESQFIKQLNKYVDNNKLAKQHIKTYITKPKIASAGIKGCMLLNSLHQA